MKAGWVEEDAQAASLATAAHAAETGKQHVVRGVSAGFSQAEAGALLTIKDGAAIIWQTYVHNSFSHQFDPGIPGTKGNAVSAELAAGTGTGAVAINGDTF